MRKILIISPHYPPSNLAAVHRSRLFAQHLPAFGWEPIILTVDELHYEEGLDWELHHLLPAGQQVEKVAAFRVTNPRLIGDIGLRAYFQLRRKALELVRAKRIDFVYIPIPSFYAALLGPYLNRKTGVQYGIDYIDPWVHEFPGSERKFSRHWWSTRLARLLEPIAVKKASVITGVAEGYYRGVQERNQHLLHSCLFGAMPYGGDELDHLKVKALGIQPYLFKKKAEVLQFVYAGALLPKAFPLLDIIFQSIASQKDLFTRFEFHFIGTGKKPSDSGGHTVKPYAIKWGLWQTVIFEYPARIPYLQVLAHLESSDAVFILGSTEPHYTPSKVYQGVLSGKPVLAVLHEQSTAANTIERTGAGIVLTFAHEDGLDELVCQFPKTVDQFLDFKKHFDHNNVDRIQFEPHSAKESARLLASLLSQATKSS